MTMKTSRLWLYRLLTAFLPETRCFGFKRAFLRWCGAKIGKNVKINSSASFCGDGRLEIGDDVWIGPRVMIGSCGDAVVRIGCNVDIAPGVNIWTGSHKIDLNGKRIAGRGYNESIAIGDGSWIGIGAIILHGVVLAPKTLVAAGAVVVKSVCSPLTLVAGVPGVAKKKLAQ